MSDDLIMELTREVRFSLADGDADGKPLNSWAGWPASDRIAPYLVLRATVRGVVDRRIGYLCNIVTIDKAVRDEAIPQLRDVHREDLSVGCPYEAMLTRVVSPIGAAMPDNVELIRLELRATPFLAYTWRKELLNMIQITQSFEFAAAHRLHCADFSDEENRAVFGKCTNPNGHGHNYVVEVTVGGEPDAQSGTVLEVGRLERIVKERVIDEFDHKHLNLDCAEFAELNPSVENITRVIWDRLNGAFGSANLAKVRVYETPKTFAEYSG
ncbi:MAG: 6-carboxytetrahydropterin synthase [Phycisphaerae bacterium]|nr:6-carboxytetrahydropterin synthase [Phycisphaerales bacterium]